ncbi:MAG: hypothetical protein ACJ780_26335 [Solirubrobacteraceae bacterium]
MKGALGAIVGGAALGGISRLASHKQRQPRVMGVPIPNQLNPRNLHLHVDTKKLDPSKLTKKVDPAKLAKKVDLKDVLRQIGDAAEQVEARSEDVRMLSGQAKRLTRKLS